MKIQTKHEMFIIHVAISYQRGNTFTQNNFHGYIVESYVTIKEKQHEI